MEDPPTNNNNKGWRSRRWRGGVGMVAGCPGWWSPSKSSRSSSCTTSAAATTSNQLQFSWRCICSFGLKARSYLVWGISVAPPFQRSGGSSGELQIAIDWYLGRYGGIQGRGGERMQEKIWRIQICLASIRPSRFCL